MTCAGAEAPEDGAVAKVCRKQSARAGAVTPLSTAPPPMDGETDAVARPVAFPVAPCRLSPAGARWGGGPSRRDARRPCGGQDSRHHRRPGEAASSAQCGPVPVGEECPRRIARVGLFGFPVGTPDTTPERRDDRPAELSRRTLRTCDRAVPLRA